MEITISEQENQNSPSPSLNGQNMDHNQRQNSYINDPKSEDAKSEEKHTDGPSSKFPRRISDVPDGEKQNSEIAAEDKSSEETKTDPGTAIRAYKGTDHL